MKFSRLLKTLYSNPSTSISYWCDKRMEKLLQMWSSLKVKGWHFVRKWICSLSSSQYINMKDFQWVAQKLTCPDWRRRDSYKLETSEKRKLKLRHDNEESGSFIKGQQGGQECPVPSPGWSTAGGGPTCPAGSAPGAAWLKGANGSGACYCH